MNFFYSFTIIFFQIKQAVIANVSWLLNTFGDQLSTQELDNILDLLLAKLKNEVTRLHTLKALHKIPTPDQLTLNIHDVIKILDIIN